MLLAVDVVGDTLRYLFYGEDKVEFGDFPVSDWDRFWEGFDLGKVERLMVALSAPYVALFFRRYSLALKQLDLLLEMELDKFDLDDSVSVHLERLDLNDGSALMATLLSRKGKALVDRTPAKIDVVASRPVSLMNAVIAEDRNFTGVVVEEVSGDFAFCGFNQGEPLFVGEVFVEETGLANFLEVLNYFLVHSFNEKEKMKVHLDVGKEAKGEVQELLGNYSVDYVNLFEEPEFLSGVKGGRGIFKGLFLQGESL